MGQPGLACQPAQAVAIEVFAAAAALHHRAAAGLLEGELRHQPPALERLPEQELETQALVEMPPQAVFRDAERGGNRLGRLAHGQQPGTARPVDAEAGLRRGMAEGFILERVIGIAGHGWSPSGAMGGTPE